MSRSFVFCTIWAAIFASSAIAQEHRVEVVSEAPTETGLSDEMSAMLPSEGFRVIRGSSRTVCEIWPCKEWETAADFKQTPERLYPFKPGQLIGFLHYTRRGKDFRDQSISKGWYSLRYGLQPIDGNHVGTSPTRDFVLLIHAEDDKSPNPVAMEELIKLSTKAAGTAHPAMLCLQRTDKDSEKKPTMIHDEDKDWWILHFIGQAAAGGKTNDLPVNLVVAGHADE